MGRCALFIGLLAFVTSPANSQDQVTALSGNVIFGAFFRVNELDNGDCGDYNVGNLEGVIAVTWFLKSLNDRNYIPGIKIGLDIYRTCSSSRKAAEGVFNLLEKFAVADNNGSSVLFGLLWSSGTEEVKVVSRWLGSLSPSKQLLLISGSATGSELSDKTLYPNFFRVIPSDRTQVKVLHKLLLKLKWNYVAIAYDDDNYGRPMALELRGLSEETGICVPVFVSLPLDSRSMLFETSAADIVQQMKNPSNGLVRAIVILGSTSTINRLVKKLADNIKYVNLVLAETVALQQMSLQTTTGQLISIARGALVTSPTYFPLPDFGSFWTKLWTNRTLFIEYAARIPWLAGFFNQVTGCDINQSGCWDNSKDLISATFAKISREKVSLYTGYHLKAAAMTAALLKQEQAKHCPTSNPGLCSELTSFIKTRTTLTDVLHNSTLSLREFTAEVSYLANDTELKFDENGELPRKQGTAEYTVYNLRRENTENFTFKQVASSKEGELIIQESEVVFYSEAGSPLTWSQRPLAQCDVNYDCLQCENDVADDVIFMDGDLYVIGILPIHEKNTQSPLKCDKVKTLAGADLAESLIFAVKQMNKKEGMFKDILPGRQIGFLLINTCSSTMLARQRLLDLFTGRLLLPDHSNSTVLLPRIMGYIGGYSSGESMAISDTLTYINKPFVQISASSTSPLLKDRSLYPYFMRPVPPDDIQAQVLLNVAVRLNASYIQLLYDKTAVYAQTLVQNIQEAVGNNYAKICIAQKIAITPVNEVSEYKWIKDELRKKSAARLVIVVMYSTEISKIMDAILPDLTANDNFFFLASESWGRRQALIEGKTKLEGSLVFSQEIPQDQSFGSYFRSLDPTDAENIWLRYFWEARKNCFFDKSFLRKGKTGFCSDEVAADYVDDPRASLYIQALYALVIGVNQTLSRLCGPAARSMCDAVTSGDIVKMLKTVKLDLYNTGERTQVFDDNGDGLVGFKILQVKRDRTVSDNAMFYKEVGSWTHETLVLDEKSLSLPGGQSFASFCPNQVECDICASYGKQPSNASNALENTSVIVGLSVGLAAVFIILIAIVICFFLRLRQTAGRQGSTTSSTGYEASNNCSVSAGSNLADYSTAFDPPTPSHQTCHDLNFEESHKFTDLPPPCSSQTQARRATYITALNDK